MAGDVVWYQLPGHGFVDVTGPDARDYLHRMTTNSVAPMAPGDIKRNLLLGGDGRLVGDFYTLCEAPESFLLVVPFAAREGLVAQLEKFIIMEKVELVDRSAHLGAVCLKGKGAIAALENMCPAVATGGLLYTSQTATGFLCPDAPMTRPKVIMWARADALGALLDELDRRFGPEQDSIAVDQFRIEDGDPVFGVDIGVSTIPLEAGLREAIDFNKGCFPGQEIVARIDNLGHPANVLVGFETTEGALQPGALVHSGARQIGRITTTVVIEEEDRNVSLALGYVKWDFRLAGTAVEIASEGDAPFACVVTDLPMSHRVDLSA